MKNYKTKKSMSPSFVFRLRERERELRTSLDPTWRSQLAVYRLACLHVMTCTMNLSSRVIRDRGLGDWARIRVFVCFVGKIYMIWSYTVILFWDKTENAVRKLKGKKNPLFNVKMEK